MCVSFPQKNFTILTSVSFMFVLDLTITVVFRLIKFDNNMGPATAYESIKKSFKSVCAVKVKRWSVFLKL